MPLLSQWHFLQFERLIDYPHVVTVISTNGKTAKHLLKVNLLNVKPFHYIEISHYVRHDNTVVSVFIKIKLVYLRRTFYQHGSFIVQHFYKAAFDRKPLVLSFGL